MLGSKLERGNVSVCHSVIWNGYDILGKAVESDTVEEQDRSHEPNLRRKECLQHLGLTEAIFGVTATEGTVRLEDRQNVGLLALAEEAGSLYRTGEEEV
jgi:hypothetical protein